MNRFINDDDVASFNYYIKSGFVNFNHYLDFDGTNLAAVVRSIGYKDQ